MSKKLSTKDIKTGGGGVSKTFQPGNTLAKIRAVRLDEFKFRENAYHLILDMEGPDLGADFEGFFIDKDNESLGRHKGQVGQVKASEWAYSDGETKSGIPVSRDIEILKFLKSLCKALDIEDWLEKNDSKHDTIEAYIKAFNKDKPFKDKFIEYCIGGKEYVNRGGYTNYDLFLPKFVKGAAPFGTTRVIKYDESAHLRKKKEDTVSEFGEDTTVVSGAAGEDFAIGD